MSAETQDRYSFIREDSELCGITLQNSQTGAVIAEVMGAKPHVKAEHLPSMIRIDGERRVEFVYDEIAEALGEDHFDHADLEEVMSTHYGRMIHTDDRTIMVAKPEDAAEELGFDLEPVQ